MRTLRVTQFLYDKKPAKRDVSDAIKSTRVLYYDVFTICNVPSLNPSGRYFPINYLQMWLHIPKIREKNVYYIDLHKTPKIMSTKYPKIMYIVYPTYAFLMCILVYMTYKHVWELCTRSLTSICCVGSLSFNPPPSGVFIPRSVTHVSTTNTVETVPVRSRLGLADISTPDQTHKIYICEPHLS